MSASLSFKRGDGVYGAPLMKFALTYDGELPSNGKVQDKWEIRKKLDPQLRELWQVHPAARAISEYRYIPLGTAYLPGSRHHSEAPVSQTVRVRPSIDLCERVERGGRKFLPLIRERIGLRCGLKILFLRKEDPGGVYQGGDMDNRLKTLFDALAVPTNDQIMADPTIEDPIHCLLEDDGLIAGLSVETQRLLSRPNASAREVRLIIEVDVRVTHPRPYNEPFLGDL